MFKTVRVLLGSLLVLFLICTLSSDTLTNLEMVNVYVVLVLGLTSIQILRDASKVDSTSQETNILGEEINTLELKIDKLERNKGERVC